MSGLDLSHLSDEQLQALANSQGHPGDSIQPAPPPVPVAVQQLPPAGTPSNSYNLDLSSLTPEQLQALEANTNPAMSTGEDVGRSAVTGAERGVTGIGAIPGNISNLVGHGAEWALHHGYGALQDFTGSNLGVPYMGAHTTNNPEGHINFAHLSGLPDQADADKAGQHLFGPYHQPQTTAGRYAERVGEFLPAAAMGGEGVAGRALNVLTPALASQAAEDVAPDNLKPWAAVGGAMAGGLVNGAGSAIVNAPHRLMADALQGVSEADVAAATDLQRRAAALGVHLTPFEAMDQVTNGGARGGTALQHFAENSPHGRRITAPAFAERPAQMNNAVRAVADTIAPQDLQPAASGLDAQRGAEGVLRRADEMRTNATRPLYAQADPQTVPATELDALRTGLQHAIAADRTGQIAPVLREFAGALAPHGNTLDDIRSLDLIRKIYRDRFDLPPNSPDALGKTQAAMLRPFVGQLDDMMERASPTFQQAKALHGDISQQIVDPMNNGPLGTMANTTKLPEQVRALYPQAPPEGAAVETGTAANLLPPEVTANLTRHNLIDTWNAANTDLVGGQNQWAGARLAKALAGHDEQAAALEAGAHAVDPSGDLNTRLADLLDTGRATGRRMAPGSLTHFNAEQAREFGLSPTPVRTLGGLLDPLEWGKNIDRAVGGAMYRRNVQTIADLLHATPDEAETLIAQARARGSGESPILAALLLQGPAAGPRP